MDVGHVTRAVVYMASLPLDANVLFLIVMATKMPIVGRAIGDRRMARKAPGRPVAGSARANERWGLDPGARPTEAIREGSEDETFSRKSSQPCREICREMGIIPGESGSPETVQVASGSVFADCACGSGP